MKDIRSLCIGSQVLWFPDIFEKGDRLLAKEWGCYHTTVSEVRNWFTAKLSRGGNPPPAHVSVSDIEKIKEIIDTDLYLGKDGKRYPRTTQAKPQQKPESDREADKLRKQKKKIFKEMWDSRRNITQIWIDDKDTDLNQHLTVGDLERGFIKAHAYYKEVFESALVRTNWSNFDHALNLVLGDDEKYNAELIVLETECRAMCTFEGDVCTWDTTTEASQWIRDMIAQKSKPASDGKEIPLGRDVDDNEQQETPAPHPDPELPAVVPAATAAPVHIEITEMDMTLHLFDGDGNKTGEVFISINESDGDITMSDLPPFLTAELNQAVQNYLEKKHERINN